MMCRVLTLEEVAEQLQVKPSWLRARCEGREVPFALLGGRYRFTPEHVDQIIATFEEKPRTKRRPRPTTAENVSRLEAKTPPRLRKRQKTS